MRGRSCGNWATTLTEGHSHEEGRLAPYWSVIDQGIVSAGAFLTIVVCARQMPADELGKLAYAIAAYGAALLVNSALLFQPASALSPPRDEQAHFRANAALVQLASSLLSATAFTVLLYVLPLLSHGTIDWVEALSVFVFLVLQQLSEFDRRISYITATARRAAVSSTSNYVVRISLLVLLLQGTAVSALSLMSIAALATAAITTRRAVGTSTSMSGVLKELHLQVTRYRWFLANIPFVYAWGRMPLYLIGSMLGMAAAGMFMTVRSITNVANAGLELIETYFAARLGREYQDDHSKYRHTVTKLLSVGFIVWLMGAVVIAYFGELILEVVSRGQFTDLVTALHVFWAANLVIFLFRVQAVHLRTSRRERAIPVGYLGGVLTTAALFMFGAVQLSITGMSLAIFVGAFAVLVSQYLSKRLLATATHE